MLHKLIKFRSHDGTCSDRNSSCWLVDCSESSRLATNTTSLLVRLMCTVVFRGIVDKNRSAMRSGCSSGGDGEIT